MAVLYGNNKKSQGRLECMWYRCDGLPSGDLAYMRQGMDKSTRKVRTLLIAYILEGMSFSSA